MPELTKRQWALAAFVAVFLCLCLTMKPHQFGTGLSRWTMIAMSGGIGYIVGWFFSPAGAPFRRITLLAVGALALLIVFTSKGMMGWTLTTLLSWIAFALAAGYWLANAVKTFLEKPVTFGSAEWATPDYLAEHHLIGDAGLRLGTIPTDKGPQPIHYAGDRHLLTIAPTRSGKGTTAIIPNLLTHAASVLVIDPKGENATITANARRAMGQTIHVVDPWHIAPDATDKPSRFNPLDWLQNGDPDITENAMLLADALVVPDGGGDAFWLEEAKALLQGLILYVATDEREAHSRHLGRVRDLLLLDGDDVAALFQRMTESVHHVVASTGARSLQKEEKLLANVLASAQAQTHFLDSPRIRASLSASDFSFADLKREAMTIYLVLPADRLQAFGRWLRLLIQQAITVNARDIAHKPDKPVLFLLDEMPSLGRLTMIEQAYRLMAGFGMQLWTIAQDAIDLKKVYGDGWEGFVANSGVITYFGSRDSMTAEYFSKLCGVTTVWNLSSAISRSVSSGKDGGSSSSGSSENFATAQRKLAFPDELMRLRGDRQLVLIENHHPIMGSRAPWFADPELTALAQPLTKRIAA